MPLLRSPNGATIDVPDDQVGNYVGYEPVEGAEAASAIASPGSQDRGALGTLNAGLTGALSGATLGLSDYAFKGLLDKGQFERLAGEREEHPIASGVGQIAGAVVPALAAPGSLLGMSPAGIVGRASADAVAGARAIGGAEGVGRALVASGVEGAVQNAGMYLSDTALSDRELSAEGLAASLGPGFAFGVAGGVAALGIEQGTIAARRLFSRAAGTEKAALEAEAAWKQTQQAAFDANDAAADIARAKLAEAKAMREQAQIAKQRAKLSVVETEQAAPQIDATYKAAEVERDQVRDAAKAAYEATPTAAPKPAAPVIDQHTLEGLYGLGITDADIAAAAPEELADAIRQVHEADALMAMEHIKAGTPDRAPLSPAAEQELSAAVAEHDAARAELEDVLRRLDPSSIELTTGQATGPAVPIAEWGPPGMRGYDPGNVPAPGPPSVVEAATGDVTAIGKKKLAEGTPAEFTVAGKRSALGTPGPHEPPQMPVTSDLPPLPVEPPAKPPVTSQAEFRKVQDAFREKLTPEEIKQSLRYTREDYNDVNRFLRGDKRVPKLGDREAEIIPALDAILDKGATTDTLVTHRAVHFDPGEAGAKLQPGDVWVDPAYQSTSYRADNIGRFGNTHFVITSPAGTKIAPVPSAAGEGEFLLARNSKLRITSRVEGKGGKVTYHATVESESPGSAFSRIKEVPNDIEASGHPAVAGAETYAPVLDDEYARLKSGLKKTLSKDERQAAIDYTGDPRSFNDKLRGGTISDSDRVRFRVLDSAIEKSPAPRDMRLYRGLDDKATSIWEGLSPGDRVIDPGYASTSSDYVKARYRDATDAAGAATGTRGAKATTLAIDVPAGYPAAAVPSVADDSEVLLRRGTALEVVSKYKTEEGHLIVRTRVVPSDLPAPGGKAGVSVERASVEAPSGLENLHRIAGEASQPSGLESLLDTQRRAGQATHVGSELATASKAPLEIRVARDGRNRSFNALMPDGTSKALADRGDVYPLIEAALPPEFGVGNRFVDSMQDAAVVHGLPANADAVRPNSLYVARPSELADRGIVGGDLHGERLTSVGAARGEKLRLDPVEIQVDPNGKLFLDDGNHRLQHAAATDSPVAIKFVPVDKFHATGGSFDITGRIRDALPKVASADDSLESLLRGTQQGLAGGKSLSELGAPARAEYAATKAEKTAAASEHFRAKAKGEPQSFASRFDQAFHEIDAKSGGNNYVKVSDLRKALPDLSREEFDKALYDLRKQKVWSMDSPDGRHVRLTPDEMAAGIPDGPVGNSGVQNRLTYVQRGAKYEPSARALADEGPTGLENLHRIAGDASREARAPTVEHFEAGGKQLKLTTETKPLAPGGKPRTTVTITRTLGDGEEVTAGTAEFLHLNDGLYPQHINIEPALQKQGVGTKIYDSVEKSTGRKILEAEDQTAAGKAFREARASKDAHPLSAAKLEQAHEAAVERAAAATTPAEQVAAEREVHAIEQQLTSVGKRPGAVEDVAAVAQAATKYEKSSARLAEALGPEAPPAAQEAAKAFRAAEDAAERKTMDRTTRAIDDHVDSQGRPRDALYTGRKASEAKIAEAEAARMGRGAAPVQTAPAATAAPSRPSWEDLEAKYGKYAGQPALPPTSKQALEAAKSARGAADATLQRARLAEMEAKAGARQAGDAAAAARAARTQPPVAAPTSTSALGSVLTTIGVAGELGVPGIPHPHDIPVIGPMLGMYLKYRAIKAAAGRFAGRIPATGDARAAALVAKAKDKIAHAVDRTLGLVAETAPKARGGLVATTAVLGHRLLDDGEPDAPKNANAQQMAAVRIREIANAVSRPELVTQLVRKEMRGVADPDLIAAAEQHLLARFEALNKVMPKAPPPNPYSKREWVPSPAAAYDVAQRLSVVHDPTQVFIDPTPAKAQTASAVFPKLLEFAQQRLIERIGDASKPVPYEQRLRGSLVFKIPLDDSLQPEHAAILATAHAPSPITDAAPAQAQPPAPSIAGNSNVTALYQTASDRRAMR